MKKSNLLLAVFLCLGLNMHTSAQQNILNYIKVYFTQAVSTSYSTTGVDAVQLNNSIFDTLAAYIGRAKYSIDIACYEYETYTGDPIYTAINDAYARGVKIRYIEDYEETAAGDNTGVADLNSSIPVLESPKDGNTACNGEDYNIMHNKFVIIDEYSPDTTNAIVWTGSPDWDENMSKGDYNNVIIFQSKVLARAYTNEFDIMWGDTTHGGASDASSSKFGSCKPNSGTHRFIIGGSEVELYFSPSDSTENHILETINSAKTDLYCGMNDFSDTVNAWDIVFRQSAGVSAYAILDAYSSAGVTPFTTILPDNLGTHFASYVNATYLYHNKYLIVNPSAPCDNPMVLTGSYNWTYSAETENDENTVIVHNDTIANIYLQAFASDFDVIKGSEVTKISNPCPTAVFTATATVTANTTECSNVGSATVTANGGTTPYTYSWSPSGGTAATATGLSAGSYTVTAQDNGGSSVTASIVITAPANITAGTTINANATACANAGSATIAPSGGTSPYTYSWTGGKTTATVTGLSAGSYTVTVKDKNDCSYTTDITITAPASVTTLATVNKNASACANTGSATVSASGGTSPYTYTWTSGSANATATGLSVGSYTVTVKDINGCTSSATVTITQPSSLHATATTTANVTCSTTGSATSSVTGGTSPYTYSWSGGAGNNANAIGLAVGTYTITITDNNGCTSSATTIITQPAGSVTVSTTITANVTCNGGDNGSAASSVSGGTSPYTYAWSGGAGTNTTASGLSAKTYTLTVTDNGGCTSLTTITITQPGILSATVSTTANVHCNGDNTGSASVTFSGGTSPYTYAWTGGGGNNATATGLSAGTYTVTIKDNCGNSSTASVIITQPASLVASASTTANVSCNGDNTGSASATFSGGTSPYTYTWTGGGGNNATATGLSAGTYTVTIRDNCGNSSTASVIITQPASLAAFAGATANVACYGNNTGSASSSATGGTSPYTYSWSPIGGNNSTANGLSAGSYSVIIMDACGASSTAFVSISQPAAAINVSMSSTEATGTNSNGTATATVSGGTAPYTYLWTPGSETSDNITGLSAGSYCCNVTDANGCSQSTCVTVNSSTGINTITNVSAIRIYPDPTNGYFTIDGVTQGQIIEMYNYMGQELNSETVTNNTTMHFDITNKPNGIYLIRILNADGTLATEKKMVKTQ